MRLSNKTIITFCSEDIGDLSPTVTVTELPKRLAANGITTNEDNERNLMEAAERITARGEPLTKRALVREAHVRDATANDFLRRWRASERGDAAA